MNFSGKTVLVTGASSGIGRACAVRFAELGCRLVLTARSREKLEQVRAEVAPAEAAVIPADLCDPLSLAALLDETLDRFGAVDILLNVAGVGLYAPAYASDPQKVRRLFELNFLAPVELTRRLVPKMRPGSAIVNVSSIGGKVPLPWLSVYSASKYALNGFSDALRMDLNGRGVQVLCVCPGFVDTPFRQNVLQGRIPEQVSEQKSFMITAERCAEEIVKGLRAGKRTVVTPRIGWLLVVAARLFPGLVYGRMARMNPPEKADSR